MIDAAALVVAPAMNEVAWLLSMLNTLVAADFPPTAKITTNTIIIRVMGIAK